MIIAKFAAKMISRYSTSDLSYKHRFCLTKTIKFSTYINGRHYFPKLQNITDTGEVTDDVLRAANILQARIWVWAIRT